MRASGRPRAVRCACACAVLVLTLAACASPLPAPAPAESAAHPAADARLAPQPRREWRFDEDGVVFDNRGPAARLAGVERLGVGRYRVDIAPEIHPVNPSPWYGFSVRSESARELELHFAYAHGYRHRYRPVLSRDGRTWHPADARDFAPAADGGARLRVDVDADALRVFAQPPLLPADLDTWASRVAGRVGGRTSVFGHSVQGRPLPLLEFGAPRGAPLLLVVGRQHPPEHTGTLALTGFVDTLAADTPRARAFRGRVRVLVAPLLNPDGVFEGHWRSNANGVDLNRDWGPFTQPETRALRDLLAQPGNGDRLAFAIDFHSTFRDVFYTVAEDPSRAPGGLLHDWMGAMQSRFPGRIEERAYAATSAVFKNWAYCRSGAPAVTYEVGDATRAEELDAVSRHAAGSLMALLERPRAAAPPPRCGPASGDDQSPQRPDAPDGRHGPGFSARIPDSPADPRHVRLPPQDP